MSVVLECRELSKHYGEGDLVEHVLQGVNMRLHRGETSILLGPSGSGKTTLLSIFGCLLAPSHGELSLNGAAVDFESTSLLADLRRTLVGFVFQQSQLLPFLTVKDNLEIVGLNAGLTRSHLARRIDRLLQHLGIDHLRHKKPEHLSHGQRQRVAIARSLLHNPPLILADEPTAALDWETGQVVADLLVEQVRENGSSLMMVTHDTRLLPKFDRALAVKNRTLVESTPSSYES